MMKKILLIVFVFAISLNGIFAQIYSFSAFNETYVPLTSPDITQGQGWDDPEIIVPLDFDFNFIGNPVDTMIITDGIIANAEQIETDTFPLFFTNGFDLIDRGGDGPGMSPIRAQIDGDPGNQIFKIEFTEAGFYVEYDERDSIVNFFSYQLWLYEKDDVIEIRFGPNNIADTSYAFLFEDFSGPIIGHYTSIDDGLNEVYLDLGILQGDPADPTFNFYSVASDSLLIELEENLLTAMPANGQVYRFGPASTVPTEELFGKLSGLSVYPNIASTIIRLDMPDHLLTTNQSMKYRVISAAGQLIREGYLKNEALQDIDVSGLSSGYHFLQVHHPEKGQVSLPFIRQ